MTVITNKYTGEVIEFDLDDYASVVQAWRQAQELEKMAKQIKDKCKPAVRELADHKGLTEMRENYQFRVSSVQRYQYDKSVMRKVLDADLFDTLVAPDKPAVDRYIKENIEELGDVSTELRNTMVEVGNRYEVIKLEKVKVNDEN